MIKKKILTISICVAIVIAIIFIARYFYLHPRLEMNFDIMRDMTDEENKNNAANMGNMTANKDYVRFSSGQYGLVCYDIEKDLYTVLDGEKNKAYDSLQIYDGVLFYRKSKFTDKTDICKIDLASFRRENIYSYYGAMWGSREHFNIVDNIIIVKAMASLSKIENDEIIEICSFMRGFVTTNGYVYHDYDIPANSAAKNVANGIELTKFDPYVNIVKQEIDHADEQIVMTGYKFER
jgi:hypothetical protein